MFEELIPMPKLTPEQIDAYLNRIGYHGSKEPTKEVLDELIWRHQLAVPFETLDCHDFHIGASVDPEVIFEKVVRRRRGGHCLEVNGSFYRLLISLGFDARPCLTRVLFGSDEYTHPIDHRTSLVTVDGKVYYCDVGLGGPMPPAGLDIANPDWQDMHGESYCVKPAKEYGWYYICRKTPNGNHDPGTPDAMRIEVMITLIECFETDFVFLNQYMSFYPTALHVVQRMINLRTEEGYRILEDDTYRELKDGIVVDEFSVTDCLQKTLKEKFAIEVDI